MTVRETPSAPAEALARALARAFPDAPPADAPPPALGVAVSGGGDSVALLVLLAEWAAPRGVTLHAVTVDHALRPGSAQEAAGVARLCARLGLPHATLRWQGWDGRGNLQDAARRARQALVGGWAAEHGLAAVALGHTRDDQAETVLMRLARGAGVDGLSAMSPARRAAGLLWLRPLLGVGREALRSELGHRGIGWVDDPTNDDARFDRVKARAALKTLAPLGITAEGLAETAERLASARAVLEAAAASAARALCRQDGGDVLAHRSRLLALPPETRDRILSAALAWVSRADYPPRRAALRRLVSALEAGRGGTLHGCEVIVCNDEIRVAREWHAVRDVTAGAGEPWDNRWHLTHPGAGTDAGPGSPATIRALGSDGLALCPDWRVSGTPRKSLISSPSVWSGTTLVAAPLAGLANGWNAKLLPAAADFHGSIFTH